MKEIRMPGQLPKAGCALQIVLLFGIIAFWYFAITLTMNAIRGTKVSNVIENTANEWLSKPDTVKSNLVVPPIPLPDSTEVLNGGSN